MTRSYFRSISEWKKILIDLGFIPDMINGVEVFRRGESVVYYFKGN
jgi:hypothetical protein